MSTVPVLAANALPIVCILCATVLAFRSREGWGWMVLLAFITASVPKVSDKLPASMAQLGSQSEPQAEKPKATP